MVAAEATSSWFILANVTPHLFSLQRIISACNVIPSSQRLEAEQGDHEKTKPFLLLKSWKCLFLNWHLTFSKLFLNSKCLRVKESLHLPSGWFQLPCRYKKVNGTCTGVTYYLVNWWIFPHHASCCSINFFSTGKEVANLQSPHSW